MFRNDLQGSGLDAPSIFGDLPDALINELLGKSEDVSTALGNQIRSVTTDRDELRSRAEGLGLLHKLPDQVPQPMMSVCGVDGSMANLRLMAFDLTAAAALAIDGIGFDSEAANGGVRNYVLDCLVTDPLAYGEELVRALMFTMEFELAHAMQQDLVLLDGALSSGMVSISLGLRSAEQRDDSASRALKERWLNGVREAVPEILVSDRVVALPKRSSSNEFMTQTGLFLNKEVDMNGRTVASLLLEGGEYTRPLLLETHNFHIDSSTLTPEYLFELNSLYREVLVVYFKPHDWSNALRIEFPAPPSGQIRDLHSKLDAIRRQCVNPAILEPYPLFVADRFVKSLHLGVSALLQALRREVAQGSSDSELAMRMMYAHRTDPVMEIAAE